MKIGYARVSTIDQDLGRQIAALKAAQCDRIFEEKISGAKSSRPELDRMLESLRPGDIVVVQKLDRLGRSVMNLLQLMQDFKNREIGFVSLSDSIDTSTAAGRMMFNMLASLAEFERELIVERVNHGLAHARSQGRVGGRPKANHASILLMAGTGQTHSEIARKLNVSTKTVKRVVYNSNSANFILK